MKKTAILAACFGTLFLMSCKKDFTCTCTTTGTTTITDEKGTSVTTVDDPSTSTVVYSKVKKSDISTTCGNSESSHTSQDKTSSGTITSVDKSTTNCTIK